MKTFIYSVVCIIVTGLTMIYVGDRFSKKQEVQRIVEMDKELNPPPYGAGPLVSIVWYKGMLWTPYKIFTNYREIEDIQYRLQYKSLESTVKDKPTDFTHEDKLAFVYYCDKENSFWMMYVPFRIEDNVFYWPYGEDKKIARLLISKEEWNSPFDYIDPSGMTYLSKKREIEEKLSIEEKDEKINRIRKPLALKDHRTPSEASLLETCNSAQQNLSDIVGFFLTAKAIDDMLLELNEKELSEKLVHAFAQVPRFISEDFGNAIKPESVERLRQFGKKYDDEGLNREEQIELFQLRKEINNQILDELQKRQDKFERILRIEG